MGFDRISRTSAPTSVKLDLEGTYTMLRLAIVTFGLVLATTRLWSEDRIAAFLHWAERVEIRSLAASFRAERFEAGRGEAEGTELARGTWRLQLEPVVRQRLAYRRKQIEGESSWDGLSGEAREWSRRDKTTRASGLVGTKPPSIFGYAEHPSDMYFLVLNDRPLRRHLEMVTLEARALEGSRTAIFLKNAERQHLLVYLMDLSIDQPLIELRSYIRPLAEFPARNSSLGNDIDLPPDFQGSICFVRKRVLESSLKNGIILPTRWSVEHALLPPGVRDVVTLDPESVRLNEPLSEEDLLTRWPPEAVIFDAARAMAFSVDDGQPVKAELISEASLDAILGEAGVPAPTNASNDPAITGCGANVLYLALRMLGITKDINILARELGIEVDQPYSSLSSIAEASGRAGRPALAVSAGSEILRTPEREPVILHVLKKSKGNPTGADHFILVDGFDPSTGTVRVFDPPQTAYRAEVSNVLDVWTGKALVFAGTVAHVVSTRPLWRTWRGLAVAGCLCVSVILMVIAFRRRRLRGQVAALAVPAAFLTWGCTDSGRKPSLEAGAIRVVGDPSHDFGRVPWTSEDLGHVFELENTGTVPVSIQDVSQSCACTSVDLPGKTIAAGERTSLLMEMDAKLVVGKRVATALVRLDNDQTLMLSLEATVESKYRATAYPTVWTLPANAEPGSTLKRTFRIIELHDREPGAHDTTTISSKAESVTIEAVGPWSGQGHGAWGFIREADAVLLYKVPEPLRPKDEWLSLELEYRPKDAKAGAVAWAPLRIQQL